MFKAICKTPREDRRGYTIGGQPPDFPTRKSTRLFIKRVFLEGEEWAIQHPDGTVEDFKYHIGGEDDNGSV